DYYDLFQILREYNYITDDISAIITWDKFEQHYQQKDEVFNRLSQNIKYLYDETIPRKYAYEGSYSEDKLAYMQAILADTEMLLKVYMGLKNDDFTELYELSDIKRTLLLEERYGELINE
ncbi:MAG: hypothetical protein J6S72_00900, partial [Lachnospiraceae bacterium]|nr:hypothetical protein [Lachnospiraceae bacterium]